MNKNPQQGSLLGLPEEVLTHSLFSFLPHNSLLPLRLVCSEIDHYLWEYWKCTKTSYLVNFRTYDHQFGNIVQTYLNRLVNLRSITTQCVKEANSRFTELGNDGFIRGLKCLKMNIEYLDCSSLVKLESSIVSDLGNVENIVRCLKELIIPNCLASADFTKFQNLKRLSILKKLPNDIIRLLKLPSSLEYLHLEVNPRDGALNAIAECQNLKELSFPLTGGTAMVNTVLESLNLTSFRLSADNTISLPSQQFFGNLTHVHTLQFPCYKDFDLRYLRSLKNLQKLIITPFSQKHLDILYSALSGLSQLESIELTFENNVGYVSTYTPISMPPSLNKVKYLRITNGFTKKPIGDLVSFLAGPSLREINLSQNLDDGHVLDLGFLKSCPLIEKMVLDIAINSSRSSLIEVFNTMKERNIIMPLKLLKGCLIDETIIESCPNKGNIIELGVFIHEGLNLEGFNKLKILNIHTLNSPIFTFQLPDSLLHISIGGPPNLNHMMKNIGRLPLLQSLKLLVSTLSDENVIEMVEHMNECPPISSIIIIGSHKLTNACIPHMARKMVNLNILLIDECIRMRDSGEISMLEYERQFVVSSLYDEFDQPSFYTMENASNFEFQTEFEPSLDPSEIMSKIREVIVSLESEGKQTHKYFTILAFIEKFNFLNANHFDINEKWYIYKHFISSHLNNPFEEVDGTVQKLLNEIVEFSENNIFMQYHGEELLDCLSKNIHRFPRDFGRIAKILLDHNRREPVIKYLPCIRDDDDINYYQVCDIITELFLSGAENLLDYFNLGKIEWLIHVMMIQEHCIQNLERFFKKIIETYMIKNPNTFPEPFPKKRLEDMQTMINDEKPGTITGDLVNEYVTTTIMDELDQVSSSQLLVEQIVGLYSPKFLEGYSIIPNLSLENRTFTVEGHEWEFYIDQNNEFTLILSNTKAKVGHLFDNIKVHCCIIFPSFMSSYQVFTHKFGPKSIYAYKHDEVFPSEPFILCMKILKTNYSTIEEIVTQLESNIPNTSEVHQLALKSPWLTRKINKNKKIQYRKVQVITSTEPSDHSFASQELDIFGSNHILYIRSCTSETGNFSIDFGSYLNSSPHIKLSYLLANETMDENSIAISKINHPHYESEGLSVTMVGYEASNWIGRSNPFKQGIYKPEIVVKENGNTYYQFTVHLVIVLHDTLIGYSGYTQDSDNTFDESEEDTNMEDEYGFEEVEL